MDKFIKNKTPSFFKSNYRITNILVSTFSALICLSVILILKKEGEIENVIWPIIISFFCVFLFSISFEFSTRLIIKISEEKRLRKIEEKLCEENPNMNMYPINPKLYEVDLTQEEYDRLKSFRVSNILSCIILGLILCVIFIDFKSKHIFLNIILPLFIIIGGVGLIGCLFDFIFEKIIKFRMRVISKIPEIKYEPKKNFFTKNKRIFYVPIYVILAFMCITIFVDFNSAHVITKIVIPCEAITIATFIIIIITDVIIDKIVKFKKSIEEESEDILSYSFDELDDMLDEERKDENEI